MSKKIKVSALPEFDMAEHLDDERAIAEYLTVVWRKTILRRWRRRSVRWRALAVWAKSPRLPG